MFKNSKSYTKIALALSLCLIIVLVILGTGTSLAWFTDTTTDIKNNFIFGELDIILSHKADDGTYKEVSPTTSVFDDNALYEPGYVQVVYLKVTNNGNVPFEYQLAINVNDANITTGVLGNEIYLPNYLKYGVIFGDDEATLNRETANILSTLKFPEERGNYPLNTYLEKDNVVVQPASERYIAVIVRMPKEVGNAANYRGNDIPKVELGITATASQITG